MRGTFLANRQIYHIYNRGVDKRTVFLNKADHQRFADGLNVFNTKENLNGQRFSSRTNIKNEDRLVNILVYCLMPNHFHLLLEQLDENGITKFVQKMTTSYTMYFNNKYKRTGALFQGVFKRSHIKSDPSLLEISKYIHLNPVKILGDDGDKKRLLEYPWSSFPDYVGERAGSLIIDNQSIILNQFDSPHHYKSFVLGETYDITAASLS
jgi:putative transposase